MYSFPMCEDGVPYVVSTSASSGLGGLAEVRVIGGT
jgi:hypothetical protein